MILASLLESPLASSVITKSDAYRICLSSKKRISEKDLINELTSQFEVHDILSNVEQCMILNKHVIFLKDLLILQ